MRRTDTADRRTAESLIHDLERLRGVRCAGCGGLVSAHQALMAIAMGFKNAPRCLPCLGAFLDQDLVRLRDQLIDYIRHRQCFSDAWNWANRAAGLSEGVLPPDLQSLGLPAGTQRAGGASDPQNRD